MLTPSRVTAKRGQTAKKLFIRIGFVLAVSSCVSCDDVGVAFLASWHFICTANGVRVHASNRQAAESSFVVLVVIFGAAPNPKKTHHTPCTSYLNETS